jgi:two-component system KDP operon response regulator KdpE
VKVLVVDDEVDLVDAIGVALRFQWDDATLISAHRGDQGVELFYEHEPDLVLLDVNMPGMNGFDVLREIRRVSDVPILMLTARTRDTDVVRSLELGADDHIAKPFSHIELLARIRAVLRRTGQATRPNGASVVLGDLVVGDRDNEVVVGGRRVRLTPAEHKLLVTLARNAGRVVTHETLIERVWGPDALVSTNNLKSLVGRLRAKIEISSNAPIIESERGTGYRVVRPASTGS